MVTKEEVNILVANLVMAGVLVSEEAATEAMYAVEYFRFKRLQGSGVRYRYGQLDQVKGITNDAV